MRGSGILGLCVAMLVLVACGGGSGGGSDGGGGPPVDVTPKLEYPVLATSVSFSLPALAAPPERSAMAGAQRGQALSAAGTVSAAGLTVALLDATVPDAPRVLATGLTAAGGTFDFATAATGVAPADLWLRLTLADGSTLRAWADGWTEITPGTEAAVQEVARLRKAGAFAGRALTAAELAAAQQSVSLLWLGRPASASAAAGVTGLVNFIRTHAPWNELLERLAAATPASGAADVAGLMPVASATWPSTVLSNGTPSALDFVFSCIDVAGGRNCTIATSGRPDLADLFEVQPTGVRLRPDGITSDPLSALLTQLGPLPLIEFAHAVGTRVLVDNPRFLLSLDNNIRASVKVTRRTYPAEPVQALGGMVQAVHYEIALLDYTTQKQVDLLVREQRWFSPQGGRVRIESVGTARVDGQLFPENSSVVANSVAGDFFAAPTLPFAGAATVRALALRHRHAVFAPASNRVYVGTASGGGQVLELDADSLATLRSAALPAVPGRLAVSPDGTRLYAGMDGTRLYAGMDGGQVAELDTATLAVVRQFALPADPYGRAYDRVYDMALDPFDSTRLLLLAGRSTVLGNSGAVLLFRAGVLVQRDAPRYSAADDGWGYYSLGGVTWTDRVDEFLGVSHNSPSSLYRFRAGTGAATDVAGLERVEDVGLQEVGGEILTQKGQVLDSSSFAVRRTLRFVGFAVQACARQTVQTALCQPVTGFAAAPPYLALLDAVTGEFIGGYKPLVAQVSNGCPELAVREGLLGLDDAVLQPMDARRSLVTALFRGNGERCSLQVWTLSGVAN